MSRADVLERARDRLSWFVDFGVVETFDDAEFEAFVEEYDTTWGPVEENLTVEDEASVEQTLVLQFLCRRARAFTYDPERIYGYAVSYPELVDEYAAIADGHLDDIRCDVDGDQSEREDARVVVSVGDRAFAGTMEYASDWADSESLHRLMNRVGETTDTEQRFLHLARESAVGVAFVPPAHALEVFDYFKEVPNAKPLGEFPD